MFKHLTERGKCVITFFGKGKLSAIHHRFLFNDTTEIKNHEIPTLTEDKQISQSSLKNTGIVKVAIVGMPNAGKSTFINNLVERNVCAASGKVHTTRKVSKAIHTEAGVQIIFLDTPGLVTSKEQKRHHLESSFVTSFKPCMMAADVVGVIHDVSNNWTRDALDNKVIKLLETYPDVPSFLVLNKIDMLKSKRKLLDLTKTLTEDTLSNQHIIELAAKDRSKPVRTRKVIDKSSKTRAGWSKFTNVFMVSSLTGCGLQEIKAYLTSLARPLPWEYSETQISDNKNEDIIVETVRAKLLDFMPQEIPYQLITEMEYYEEADNGAITAAVLVKCPNARIERLLQGASNGKLRQINDYVTKDLRNTFTQPINVSIATTIIK